jgi:hypothetical protein
MKIIPFHLSIEEMIKNTKLLKYTCANSILGVIYKVKDNALCGGCDHITATEPHLDFQLIWHKRSSQKVTD